MWHLNSVNSPHRVRIEAITIIVSVVLVVESDSRLNGNDRRRKPPRLDIALTNTSALRISGDWPGRLKYTKYQLCRPDCLASDGHFTPSSHTVLWPI